MSIFGKGKTPPNKVGRNTVDLSFQNNVTCNFGDLIPVFCKEVVPGDSMRIDTTFGLRFMPMVFPVQTRMRADIKFFYVRNRPSWKDWPDFITSNKDDVVLPYMAMTAEQKDKMFRTGQIGDYMGVPTTVVGEYGDGSESVEISYADSESRAFVICDPFGSLSVRGDCFLWPNPDVAEFTEEDYAAFMNYINFEVSGVKFPTSLMPQDAFNSSYAYSALVMTPKKLENVRTISVHVDASTYNAGVRGYGIVLCRRTDNQADSVSAYQLNVLSDFITNYTPIVFGDNVQLRFDLSSIPSEVISQTESILLVMKPYGITSGPVERSFGEDVGFNYVFGSEDVQELYESSNLENPYGADGIALSALPFRAYEAIYNCYYRDERNNPYILNGQKEYNKWIPTDEGGADTNVYELHKRNWEQDFLTTAVPSPQQGIAPLVGISSTGVLTIKDPDTGVEYQVQSKVADDGDTIIGADFTENLPNSVTRSLVDYATSGISINDFRNVNALQRWLEANIRRGLKYRDQIKTHYDVNTSYAELDMPEFIGGVSQDVSVSQVNQTSAGTDDSPLGSYAGQAYAVGSSRNKVEKYCDEHGYIIGIMCVYPVANYSQLLPKHFIKRDVLDYFFPEFNHIGLQPIRYSEVCPNQVAQDADTEFSDVFGYQRPWYDYLSSTDEVHGLFRTNLRNFLINRTFDEKPTLSPSFLLIDNDQVNDVFSVTESDHKILGQLYFDVKAKRPISLYGIPKID